MNMQRFQPLLRHTLYAVRWVARLSFDPRDDDITRLRKSVGLTSVVFGAIPASIIIGLLFSAFGETFVGWLALSFAALMAVSVIVVSRTHNYSFYNLYCLTITALAPFLASSLLGGIAEAGFIMVWAAIAPLVALITNHQRYAFSFFLIITIEMILLAVLKPYLPAANQLPPAVITSLIVGNILSFLALFFALLYYFVIQNETLLKIIRLEQEKADGLLLNILPKDIATILKDEQRVIADHFSEVSILFADIVNFTPMSATMTPIELVELLNDVFSYIDSLVDKYGLEKIKTIGDCYMVAAGVPRPRQDHAHALARLGIDIQTYMNTQRFLGNQTLSFRIGINSGSVVAGVIGRKKFIYDLWGDTVNTASRMESHGVGGFIQVTESTYNLIKDDFECEPRGTIHVKGKGEMPVWYIVGEKPAS